MEPLFPMLKDLFASTDRFVFFACISGIRLPYTFPLVPQLAAIEQRHDQTLRNYVKTVCDVTGLVSYPVIVAEFVASIELFNANVHEYGPEDTALQFVFGAVALGGDTSFVADVAKLTKHDVDRSIRYTLDTSTDAILTNRAASYRQAPDAFLPPLDEICYAASKVCHDVAQSEIEVDDCIRNKMAEWSAYVVSHQEQHAAAVRVAHECAAYLRS